MLFASVVAQTVKNLPAMQETRVWSLSWEDPLGKEVATPSRILAWRIPWTLEAHGLHSPWDHKESGMTEHVLFIHIHQLFTFVPFARSLSIDRGNRYVAVGGYYVPSQCLGTEDTVISVSDTIPALTHLPVKWVDRYLRIMSITLQAKHSEAVVRGVTWPGLFFILFLFFC